MSAVNNLLDKYRNACSLTSDSAVAESLHIKRQAVHQWRKGASWPSEDHVLAMTKAMQEPAERWFVAISAERASPAARKVWLRLAQMAAAVTLAVGLSPANSAPSGGGFPADNPGHVYIMSTVVRALRKAWHAACNALRPLSHGANAWHASAAA